MSRWGQTDMLIRDCHPTMPTRPTHASPSLPFLLMTNRPENRYPLTAEVAGTVVLDRWAAKSWFRVGQSGSAASSQQCEKGCQANDIISSLCGGTGTSGDFNPWDIIIPLGPEPKWGRLPKRPHAIRTGDGPTFFPTRSCEVPTLSTAGGPGQGILGPLFLECNHRDVAEQACSRAMAHCDRRRTDWDQSYQKWHSVLKLGNYMKAEGALSCGYAIIPSVPTLICWRHDEENLFGGDHDGFLRREQSWSFGSRNRPSAVTKAKRIGSLGATRSNALAIGWLTSVKKATCDALRNILSSFLATAALSTRSSGGKFWHEDSGRAGLAALPILYHH